MIIYTLIILISIALDQLSKYLVVTKLKDVGTKPLIQNVLHFTYAENTGAAFSMLKGMQSFLVLFTSLAMAALFVYLVKISKSPDYSVLLKVSFAMLIGGGIGNLIDRLRLGYVIDFIDFRLIKFAIFNIADSFVVISVILMIIAVFIERE